MTADETHRDYELNAALTSIRALREEVAYWKSRYEAAVQAHEADIEHLNQMAQR